MIDFKNSVIFKLKQTDTQNGVKLVQELLLDGEQVLAAYKGIRDYVVFTDKRAISVNVQGVTGKKRDYSSLPYASVSAFSVETPGLGDIDGQLDLWYSGLGKIHFEFSGGSNVTQIAQLISQYAL